MYKYFVAVVLFLGTLRLSAGPFDPFNIPGNIPKNTVEVRVIRFGEFSIKITGGIIVPMCFGERMKVVRRDEHGYIEFTTESERGSARLFLKLLPNGVLVIDYQRISVMMPMSC